MPWTVYRFLNRRHQRYLSLILGGLLWVCAMGMVIGSVHTVRARTHRHASLLTLCVPHAVGLLPGDQVFLTTNAGLERIGEVTHVGENDRIELALSPEAFTRLDTFTQATCWRTPLSAEQTLPSLLPKMVQRRVAERIAMDWRQHEDQLSEAWMPLARELASAYFSAISDDVEASFRRHQEEVWAITRTRARAIAAEWPAIEEQLGPILQEHLTPVLGRLMQEALSDAPKISIAWSVARGQHADAFQHMLDWLANYLATMSDQDKDELATALQCTWDAARADPMLADRLSQIGRGILEDPQLRDVLTRIFREAVVENPETAAFLQREVKESPRVRAEMYAFIEAFAPTARSVLAVCLFDEEGRTRPEIAHLLRWASLGRNVAWVTLETGGGDHTALSAGSTLTPVFQGTRP